MAKTTWSPERGTVGTPRRKTGELARARPRQKYCRNQVEYHLHKQKNACQFRCTALSSFISVHEADILSSVNFITHVFADILKAFMVVSLWPKFSSNIEESAEFHITGA